MRVLLLSSFEFGGNPTRRPFQLRTSVFPSNRLTRQFLAKPDSVYARLPEYSRTGVKSAGSGEGFLVEGAVDSGEITSLLKRVAAGDQDAAEELVPLVYGELRRIAVARLRRESPQHTLQATALVHEAYIKLAGQRDAKWKNRAQFFAVASQAMRRILVDYARTQLRSRRGGRPQRIPLDEVVLVSPDRTEELLTVHESY